MKSMTVILVDDGARTLKSQLPTSGVIFTQPPWRAIVSATMNLSLIPALLSADVFHVVVEAPRGSTLKLKYEPRWHAMSVARPLPVGVAYPSTGDSCHRHGPQMAIRWM